MDSLPGRKGKPMADSVHLGSESIDNDSIERIKAEEEELLKKLKDTDSEKKNIETSLKLTRERLINKLKYDVEDLQKSLADTKLDNDRLSKELAEQKNVVRFSFKEKQQLVEDLEGRCRALEKEVEENRQEQASFYQLKAENQQIKAENHQIRSYAEDMLTDSSRLDQKLRKSREEIDSFKQQLVQQAEDNARQKQKLSEEMHCLHSDNKQLKSRISELVGAKSELVGAKLMDNTPDIADLSDPNRALKLGERFSSLYDDEWTDHFQILTEKYRMKDEEAIQQLLEILLKTYEFCRKVGDEQMDILCTIFEHPGQNIPQALTMKPQTETLQMTQKHHKELKDLRKKIALKQVDSISKQYLAKESEEAKKKGDKKQRQILDEMRTYYEKCVEVCWPMILHDPPVRMEMKVQPGVKIDPNRYRLYGGNGDTLEYLVWPPLFVEGGELIAKGIAKPKKVPRTPKK